jgi:hypothetical protein
MKNEYRMIHKPLLDFRPLRYSSRDGHAEGEHVNRGRDNPSFCPTLQVLDISTIGDAADVNPVIKFLPYSARCATYELLCIFSYDTKYFMYFSLTNNVACVRRLVTELQ